MKPVVASFLWTIRSPGQPPVKKTNLVTTPGLSWLAGRVGGTVTNATLWLALGSDNSPPLSNQTALGNELLRAQATVSVGAARVNYRANFTPTNTITVREVGAFTAAVGGTMVSRAVTAPRVIPANEASTVTLDILFRDYRAFMNVLDNISDYQLTTINPEVVLQGTPVSQGNYVIFLYLTVTTPPVNVTITYEWTDALGARQTTVINQQVGDNYVQVTPQYINATPAPIKVTVTAGTANEVRVSGSIVQI